MNRAAWIAQQRGRKAVLYVVRVYTADEAFYKVGVTYNISARWSRIKTLYRWRTLARYSSWDAAAVFDLELYASPNRAPVVSRERRNFHYLTTEK